MPQLHRSPPERSDRKRMVSVKARNYKTNDMRIIYKIIAGLTSVPFAFSVLLIFPCLGFGIIFCLASIVYWLYCLFTFQIHNIGDGEFDLILKGSLPLYVIAAIHMIICDRNNLEVGYPLMGD